MDSNLLQGLCCTANSHSQTQTLQYFEQLKESPDGWKLCGNALIHGINSDDNTKFFCFQVLEHHVRTRHASESLVNQQSLREILMTWLQAQCSGRTSDKNFIKNKASQVFALTFVVDYPNQWLSFFSDLHQILHTGAAAVDMYLRILKAIDDEVVDREVARTSQEMARNTMIKDFMREQCVPEMTKWWLSILETYGTTNSMLTCSCLDVVGAFVSWIDINLVANDKFISMLLNLLSVDVLRESVCDCFHEIISKGMDPVAKTELVESLIGVLESAAILPPTEETDIDFLAKLAKLINGIGSQLISSYNKLVKSGDATVAANTLKAIENKIQLLFRFLGDDDDDISHTVNGFAHSYFQLLKQMSTISDQQKQTLEGLLYVIIKKMTYDDLYNFDQEGEDEVMFMEYRKEMKVLFDNISQLDANLVLMTVHNVLSASLGRLEEAEFMEVEMAIRLVFMLGEALPGQQLYTDSRFPLLQQMMGLIVSSRLSYYSHSAVSLMFFETVVRYDRFFTSQPQHIPTVLIAFLDERGLRNPNSTVRSRCCYLLSRFIKSHRNHMQNYVDDVLKRFQGLLVVSSDNGYHHLLSADEQLFLYESAGMLVASSNASQEKQLMYMNGLLSPVIIKFGSILSKLMSGDLDAQASLSHAQLLYSLVSFASRASKAFPNQQTLKQSGCAPCFKEALPLFLQALTCPLHREIIHNGIRQYLHRMVICLGDDVLPFIPIAVTHLLEKCSARDIQDFIPLINQIIAKFKILIVPFLRDVFMAIVNTIFTVLNKPAEEADTQAAKEKETLRRSYFLFIAAIVNNEVSEVLTSQEPHNVQQVLLTLIQGAVEYPDPVAQKICFNVLRKLVELWGGSSGENGFKDFLYDNIVPACFLAPMKSTFDMNDAQTFLAMQEIAQTQKMILQKQGIEFLDYLQSKYLPSLNLSPPMVQEYTQALQHADIKTFKNYTKVFFTQLQT
ncbi:exportin-T isoform X1 [Nematostella vectensis]|uniref:exportin-T isoform X1 n=1 Tax=Nematostella vectensis TaxID=45351 RepID=UPI0020778E6C|nr:exportin-T isoform X1 [Nematostella vectensis]